MLLRSLLSLENPSRFWQNPTLRISFQCSHGSKRSWNNCPNVRLIQATAHMINLHTHTITRSDGIPWKAFLVACSTLFKQHLRVLPKDIGMALHFTFCCHFEATSSHCLPRTQPPQIPTDCFLFLNLRGSAWWTLRLEPQLSASCCEWEPRVAGQLQPPWTDKASPWLCYCNFDGLVHVLSANTENTYVFPEYVHVCLSSLCGGPRLRVWSSNQFIKWEMFLFNLK